MSKQCRNVKTVVGLKCQNGAGVSKLCRYILSKWCMFRTISVEAELDRIIIYSYFKCNRTNECSGQSKQSEFTRLASILRYVTKLDIVIVAISYFDIKSQFFSGVYQSVTWQNGRIGQFLVHAAIFFPNLGGS